MLISTTQIVRSANPFDRDQEKELRNPEIAKVNIKHYASLGFAPAIALSKKMKQQTNNVLLTDIYVLQIQQSRNYNKFLKI